ncbi:hypothetical protein [Streptomyces sp. 1222.5]|uniref:hypothetical protein n=1 Tax=Streptomyces sp. 1222.5 TaxID=1881026 RepID=UPI003EBFF18D
MSLTVFTSGTSRKRRLALLAATTGLAAGGVMIPATAFAGTPPAHTAPAHHGPHGHGSSTKTTTTGTTTENRRGTTTTKTTTTETTTNGRHKFHSHDQNIAHNAPVNRP